MVLQWFQGILQGPVPGRGVSPLIPFPSASGGGATAACTCI